MAEPLLDFLAGRAKAALPFLRGAVAQGLNINQIINALQASGIGTFRRQSMLDIIAALQNRFDPTNPKLTRIARFMRLVPETTVLPPEAHTVNVVTAQGSNYEYVVRLQSEENPVPRYITVVSEIPLSAANVYAVSETTFYGYAAVDQTPLTIDPGDQTIIEANVSPTAP